MVWRLTEVTVASFGWSAFEIGFGLLTSRTADPVSGFGRIICSWGKGFLPNVIPESAKPELITVASYTRTGPSDNRFSWLTVGSLPSTDNAHLRVWPLRVTPVTREQN